VGRLKKWLKNRARYSIMRLELIEMRTTRVYLETTMFNYYFEPEREAHADTVKLFEEIRAGKYQAFTSMYAVEELQKAPAEKAQKMADLITEFGVIVLETSEEARTLAMLYQDQGIIPPGSTVDAQHIAVASVNDMDMIISLNFRHIVRKKTETMTGRVNADYGYKPIEIHSPMEVVERENT
jgi:predicted nucleic acid-binding protein